MIGLVEGGAADVVGRDAVALSVVAGLKRIFGGAGCGNSEGEGGEGNGEEQRVEVHDKTKRDVFF